MVDLYENFLIIDQNQYFASNIHRFDDCAVLPRRDVAGSDALPSRHKSRRLHDRQKSVPLN